ncbi:hypothetical protein EON82_13670, partial [bacterium]
MKATLKELAITLALLTMVGSTRAEGGPHSDGAGAFASSGTSQSVAGSVTQSLAFILPPGRHGVTPSLAITYDSMAGDGELGDGWRLALPEIRRVWGPKTGPDSGMTPSGRFEYDGRPLVPVCSSLDCSSRFPDETFSEASTHLSRSWVLYRLQEEGAFLRFFFNGTAWYVESQNGARFGFSSIEGSPDEPTRFCLSYQADAHILSTGEYANPIQFIWEKSESWDKHNYLKEIFYTSETSEVGNLSKFAHHVSLTWETRPGAFHVSTPPSAYDAWQRRLERRLARVDISSREKPGVPRALVRRYELGYLKDLAGTVPNPQLALFPEKDITAPRYGHSYLRQVQQVSGCGPVEDDKGMVPPAIDCPKLPPVTYRYSYDEQLPAPTRYSMWNLGATEEPIADPKTTIPVDLDRDGYPDFLHTGSFSYPLRKAFIQNQSGSGTLQEQCVSLSGTYALFNTSSAILPGTHVDDRRLNMLWVAMGDVRSGFLDRREAGHGLCPSTSPGGDSRPAWQGSPTTTPMAFPGTGSLYRLLLVGNINGDGIPDALLVRPGNYPLEARFGVRRTDRREPFGGTPQQTNVNISSLQNNKALDLADVDGDGLDDLFFGNYYLHGDGTGNFGDDPGGIFPAWFPTPVTGNDGSRRARYIYDMQGATIPPAIISHYDLSQTTDYPLMHDINGDGLADMIVPYDGLTDDDLIRKKKKSFRVYINMGHSRMAQYCAAKPELGHECTAFDDPSVIDELTGDYSLAYSRTLFADINASGNDDIVVPTMRTVLGLDLMNRSSGPPPGLLIDADNGLGAHTSFEYSSLQEMARRDGWRSTSPVPQYLVTEKRVWSDNPGQAPRNDRTQYAYRNAAFDPSSQKLLGFEFGSQTTSSGVTTETHYAFDPCYLGEACNSDYDSGALRGASGVPVSIVVRFLDHIFSQDVLDYRTNLIAVGSSDASGTADSREVWHTYMTRRTHRLLDVDTSTAQDTTVTVTEADPSPKAGELYKLTVTVPMYSVPGQVTIVDAVTKDIYGSTVSTLHRGRVVSGTSVDEEVSQALTWDRVAGRWLFAPSKILTTGSTGAAAPSVNYFDYYDSGALKSSHAALSGVTDLGVQGEAHELIYQTGYYEYDSYGNRTKSVGPSQMNVTAPNGASSRCTTSTFDPNFADWGESTTDWDSEGCTGRAFTYSTSYNRGTGLLQAAGGPSGSTMDWAYDHFGRVTQVRESEPETPQLHRVIGTATYHHDFPNGLLRSRVTIPRPGGDDVVVNVSDAFGERVLTMERKGASNEWRVSGLEERRSDGIVTGTFRPWTYQGEPFAHSVAPRSGPPDVSFFRDVYGRTLTVHDAGHLMSKRSYGPLAMTMQNADHLDPSSALFGRSIRIELDGHGRTLRVAKPLLGGVQLDEYEYDFRGMRTRWTQLGPGGAAPVVRRYAYDTFGRLGAAWDPSVSDSAPAYQYSYDTAGNLVAYRDIRGCGENLFYDGLSRMTGRDDVNCTAAQAATAPASTIYHYDEPFGGLGDPAFALGRLTGIEDRGSSTGFEYDAGGRVLATSRRLAVSEGGTPSVVRYADHIFRESTKFDSANQVEYVQVENLGSPLGGDDGQAQFTFTHDSAGRLKSIGGTYGSIIRNLEYQNNGQLERMEYGDFAKTTVTHLFDERDRLTHRTVSRLPGSLPPTGGAYTAPTAADYTTQLTLEASTFGLDAIGRPTTILDAREPA